MLFAIDGPSGSGKSTTAKLLARRLGLGYLDTGALYRAATTEFLLSRPDGATPRRWPRWSTSRTSCVRPRRTGRGS
ncbi:hypothetical protein G7085_20195 [Tessaracoccus sp. HDW20]|nr:(d)CMP kinase [Tessaracoccus coleopterorum]NHB86065.1 hypothetical protein [Tessaracoccus coleopterorum]